MRYPSAKWLLGLASAVVTLLFPNPSSSRTWHVNPAGTGDAPTIAAAFDSSTVGDDVLLAPGTYYEYYLAIPVAVNLHSEAGRDATVIDGEYRGIVLLANEFQWLTTIEGITVQHGTSYAGGGLRVYNALVAVRDCRFRENHADLYGAGVFCQLAYSYITSITGTIFEDNSASAAGGGLWIADTPTMSSSEGGGLRRDPIDLADCVFVGNTTDGEGGAGFLKGAAMTVSGCFFVDNIAGARGGGLALGPSGDWEILHCTFLGNQTEGNGGAIDLRSNALVSGCLIASNSAGRGGGIYAAQSGSPTSLILRSSTLVANTATSGAGVYSEFADATFETSIIAFNSNHGIYPEYLGPPPPVSCCDVFGNSGGNYANGMPDPTGTDGNISVDPLFCDPDAGDYTLQVTSPCLPGQHPGGADCGLIGALDVGCGSTATTRATWGTVKSRF